MKLKNNRPKNSEIIEDFKRKCLLWFEIVQNVARNQYFLIRIYADLLGNMIFDRLCYEVMTTLRLGHRFDRNGI
jgi:hypothetical protein